MSAWEEIHRQEGDSTWRMWVPGGWLVRTLFHSTEGISEALTFYPDANHRWGKEDPPQIVRDNVKEERRIRKPQTLPTGSVRK